MRYKNIHSYQDFILEKNKLNESIFSFLKGVFKKLSDFAKKVKESSEIDAKIEEWKKEIDKLIDEKKADLLSNTGGATGNVSDSYRYRNRNRYTYLREADENVAIDMPDFIKKLGTEKSTGNPIDDAINQFLNNKKVELMPYINSKLTATRLYTYAKLAELNSYILNKKIELYKTIKGKEKELKETQDKLKAIEEESKKINAKIEEEMNKENKMGELKEGDEVIYKRDKWNEEAEKMWNSLSDEDKNNPEKLKPLLDKEYIAKRTIVKISGNDIDLGDNIKKTKDDVLLKIDKTANLDKIKNELTNSLKEISTKNPGSIDKINQLVSLYKEPDKNKDTLSKIEDLLKEK